MAKFVVNSGLQLIVNRLLGIGTAPNYLGVGTGIGITQKSDTTLFNEQFYLYNITPFGESPQRISCDISTTRTYSPDDTFIALSQGFKNTTGIPFNITNFGLFDAPVNGNLFVKLDTANPILMHPGDTISFIISVVF